MPFTVCVHITYAAVNVISALQHLKLPVLPVRKIKW